MGISAAILMGVAVILQLGCAGNVTTTALSPDALNPGKSVKGLVFYPPEYFKLTYAFGARVDKDGKLLGTSDDGKCTPVIQKEELSIMPDFSRPMMLENSSGAFSAAKFSVTLSNGMLASVNAEPTQKLSDILSASAAILKEVPGVLGVLPMPSLDACNASPRLVGFQKQTLK